jgi:hypothetical protein
LFQNGSSTSLSSGSSFSRSSAVSVEASRAAVMAAETAAQTSRRRMLDRAGSGSLSILANSAITSSANLLRLTA